MLKTTTIFKDILSYNYSLSKLDKDIQTLLLHGSYKPTYTDLTIPYLQQEVQNFQLYFIKNRDFTLSIYPLSLLCDKKMMPQQSKIKNFLKQHHIIDTKEKDLFKHNIWNECFGCGYIHSYHTSIGRDRIYLYDMVENPFYTIYTCIHELTHAFQDKEKFQIYRLKKEEKLRDYKEIHANLTAGTFMMIKALQTKNPAIIKRTKEKLLSISSRISNIMKTPALGVRYFDWKGLQLAIKELPKIYTTLLSSNSQINWTLLYEYTINLLKRMEYKPANIKYTKVFLKQHIVPLWTKNTTNKEFFNKIKHLKGKDAIFDDFLVAFKYFIKHPYTELERLEQFYQRLANPMNRKTTLGAVYYDNLPKIKKYRKIACQSVKM